MSPKELEEHIYEYGETMKHIGRCETNDKSSTKEYNRLISAKEKLIEKFDSYFKNLKRTNCVTKS
jgi:translation initiation factor 2 beta subunit (eIF-2beta)/eIF-5